MLPSVEGEPSGREPNMSAIEDVIGRMLNRALQPAMDVLYEIKEIVMTSAQDVQAQLEALAGTITTDETAFATWASAVVTIVTNVEAALAAAVTANPAANLDSVTAAVGALTNAVTTLPVEVDPTVTPPAPTP